MPFVGRFTITVTIDRIATGGAGIANAPDGRVVLVQGGLPGDEVLVEITKDKKRLLQGHVDQVLQPGSNRVDASCSHFLAGCGGCDWQHSKPEAAVELRRQIVLDSLRRLAGIEHADVQAWAQENPPLPHQSYRTTVRAAVVDGRTGFRRARSNDIVAVDDCETAHPLARSILEQGRFPGASEVVIRVGANTGERMVISDAAANDFELMSLPEDVKSISSESLKRGQSAWIHEEVSGHTFRVSANSFFQCRPDGAAVLVELAQRAIAGVDGPLIDAYGGVGLFGALLGQGRQLTSIESNPSSVADAALNLPSTATVLRSKVERWKPTPAGVVVADPARRGLGRDGVATLAATGASVLCLVSCDPASLARDAGLLVEAGFSLDWIRTVDLFGQTSHVEAVTKFSR